MTFENTKLAQQRSNSLFPSVLALYRLKRTKKSAGNVTQRYLLKLFFYSRLHKFIIKKWLRKMKESRRIQMRLIWTFLHLDSSDRLKLCAKFGGNEWSAFCKSCTSHMVLIRDSDLPGSWNTKTVRFNIWNTFIGRLLGKRSLNKKRRGAKLTFSGEGRSKVDILCPPPLIILNPSMKLF